MTKQEYDRYTEVSKKAEEILKRVQDILDTFMSATIYYAPEMQGTYLYNCMANISEDISEAIFEAENGEPFFYEDTDSVYSPPTGEG